MKRSEAYDLMVRTLEETIPAIEKCAKLAKSPGARFAEKARAQRIREVLEEARTATPE
jgi:hypothetical protein